MKVAYSPEELAVLVEARRTAGKTSHTVSDIASLATARPGDLSFLGNAKYRSQVEDCAATVILLPVGHEGLPRVDQVFLYVDSPSVALARICARIEQTLWPKPAPGVHPTAVIDPSASVDPTAHVGPLCVIEAGARIGAGTVLQASVFVGSKAVIGAGCWIMPGATVASRCELGDRVRLQPGAVVGSDGFGYEFTAGRHQKIPQIGNVILGDDVEIGANSTLDRARFSRTVVGEGTKIDNLVQIAHNVVIGRHCILCAQVGVAGSTTIEDFVILGGQVGVNGHITIAKGSKAGGQAAVMQDLPAGSYVNGSPAIPFMLERRLEILKRRLPDLFQRVAALEKNNE